jgi:hypothetical protein
MHATPGSFNEAQFGQSAPSQGPIQGYIGPCLQVEFAGTMLTKGKMWEAEADKIPLVFEVTADKINLNNQIGPKNIIEILADQDTWLCTEIDKYIGLTKEDFTALKKLRRFTVKNHKKWMLDYWEKGADLVEAINKTEAIHTFYKRLKAEMVDPVIALVKEDKLEEAFDKYKADTILLAKTYTPEILEGINNEV